jgi:proline iminopeptidase
MADLSRRDLLLAGGTVTWARTSPLLAATTPSAQLEAARAVPSTRADGVRTGGSRTVRIDGKYEVWVKQVGTGNTPVLTLHGGPGFNHFYLECLEDFLPQADVRFWYYDQLGCGFSDSPDDVSLWTIDRYREEVEQVRQALGLERFILYGHSWGGMLGMEYALRYPQHLAGLVVSNMTASVAEYVKYAAVLVSQLPPAAQAVIARHRAKGDFEAPEYQ